MNTIEERQRIIGGTDIAGILGLSRYKTPLSVWAEKTGQVELKNEDSLQKKLGRRLEEVVAELFTEKTGLKVQRANERRIHPKYPMFGAQIDRLVIGTDELLECKTASAWLKKEWADEEIPQEYICQVMWQLACSGRKRAHIAALIGNEDFRIKVVDRDPVMISEMLKRAKAFWEDFVLTLTMPTQIGAKDTETLLALFPQADIGKEVEMGDQGAKLCETRASLCQDVIMLEKQIESLENEIKAILRDAAIGNAGNYRISWTNVSRKAYEVPAKQFRMFKIRPKMENENG